MMACLVCAGAQLTPIFALAEIPVACNTLTANESEARNTPRGSIDLVFCDSCGLVFNRAFDSARIAYVAEYENALHHSPSFQHFAERLVEDLVARHSLVGKRVVEIGCGDGFMLSLFRKHGVIEAVGFDPSMEGRTTAYSDAPGVRIIPEYFNTSHLDDAFDFVLCRHVLEHLSDPCHLLNDLRRQIGDRHVPIYFEVPNAEWMLRTVSHWDVIYEHVAYYTSHSIKILFHKTGFSPTRIDTDYGDQFLLVEALPGSPELTDFPDVSSTARDTAMAFGQAATCSVSAWRGRLLNHAGRIVLWGAGSKGVSFVNAVGSAGQGIVAAVDLNPRKHGRHLPGTALPVVAPERLKAIDPDLVLVCNGLYAEEIVNTMAAMGLRPDTAIVTA